eukprot:snap_masked-scaffold_23-processed-gene-2.37-mRNA-1 protein AED:1.00 eAED:1.00 QI:0/0/0/0/1/1/2/0/159
MLLELGNILKVDLSLCFNGKKHIFQADNHKRYCFLCGDGTECEISCKTCRASLCPQCSYVKTNLNVEDILEIGKAFHPLSIENRDKYEHAERLQEKVSLFNWRLERTILDKVKDANVGILRDAGGLDECSIKFLREINFNLMLSLFGSFCFGCANEMIK